MADRPALEPVETEITPEMIEAGLVRLLSFNPERDLAEEVVEAIFRDMVKVKAGTAVVSGGRPQT